MFVFVSFWHCPGSNVWVFFWVWMNFSILSLETLGQFITKTKAYECCSKTIGSSNMNRMNKLFGSQLLIFQTALAVLFLTGQRVYLHILNEIYMNNTILSYSILSLAVYSIYHVSDLIFQYEKLNKSNDVKQIQKQN